jgi:hypothetical protein
MLLLFVHSQAFSTTTKNISTCMSVQVVYNGLFGVGAPEALLVGVVALVVFGPQGLVEVCPAGMIAKCCREFDQL